jgi:hypothetical protein
VFVIYLRPFVLDFFVLDDLVKFRFTLRPARLRGAVQMGDARNASKLFPRLRSKVRLVVTSPPYLDVTDYAEDQWLRLWFLGGNPFPSPRQFRDDRLTRKEEYWSFLQEAWTGMAPLLAPSSQVVIRIGGKLPEDELAKNLLRTLREGFGSRRVKRKSAPSTSEVKGRQTNIFRPGAGRSVEHDFVFAIQ